MGGPQATGDPPTPRGRGAGGLTYAPSIAASSDDVPGNLPIPPPPGTVEPPEPPRAPSAAVDEEEDVRSRISEDTQELLGQMGTLREQLDAAFDEVVGRIDGLEGRMRDLSYTLELHVDRAREAEARSALMVEVLQGLAAGMEKILASRSAGSAADAGDGSRAWFETGLAHLSQQILELRRVRPQVEVDTTLLEEAAHRDSLRNAADIANLRQDIQNLVETIRRKDEGIGELRATVSWMKERMLH